jgi:hypothetical protein
VRLGCSLFFRRPRAGFLVTDRQTRKSFVLCSLGTATRQMIGWTDRHRPTDKQAGRQKYRGKKHESKFTVGSIQPEGTGRLKYRHMEGPHGRFERERPTHTSVRKARASILSVSGHRGRRSNHSSASASAGDGGGCHSPSASRSWPAHATWSGDGTVIDHAETVQTNRTQPQRLRDGSSTQDLALGPGAHLDDSRGIPTLKRSAALMGASWRSMCASRSRATSCTETLCAGFL